MKYKKDRMLNNALVEVHWSKIHVGMNKGVFVVTLDLAAQT